jgi:CBS domain-containing protein
VTVDLHDGLSHCCKVMIENGIHRVFVKDSENIVGVLSTTDIVKAFAN